MADAVTSQTLLDGVKNAVIKFTNISDGTGESAVLKVDVSTLSGGPSEVKLQKIIYDISGMQVVLLWDATADETAYVLAPGQNELCFEFFGGIKNNAGAGKTGDLLFTTIGASANDTYTIILYLTKVYS